MDYRSPVAKKEWHSAATPAWTGFYCFSGYITSRMVLIYYAQVAVGDYLLQITKERMLLIASNRRMLQIRGKVVELVTLHTWEV